mmetsp:Transcript_26327/g.61230  ORF Transcript_26327/g.61230 Transcript_26327/m.61230 type:complete len:655 (+) Transcript_26327:319-2283(+)
MVCSTQYFHNGIVGSNTQSVPVASCCCFSFGCGLVCGTPKECLGKQGKRLCGDPGQGTAGQRGRRGNFPRTAVRYGHQIHGQATTTTTKASNNLRMVGDGMTYLQPAPVSPIGDNHCRRCGGNGCDVKVMDCGCHLHARCTPVVEGKNMTHCPGCNQPCRGIYLLPMSFTEIDEARKVAAVESASGKREKKRKTATIARLNPEVSASGSMDEKSSDTSDLRTGRWTIEEMAYCDKLTEKFETGQLPVADGVKLNDFLSKMLKSKQSRLTKKMKNAKLSAKSFRRTTGYIVDPLEARLFSELEDSFFRSITCTMERAEVRFHLQKEWRELFSSFCVQLGQKLEADAWLASVEEMDRRASRAKDAARMARRKKMMGVALQQDGLRNSTQPGVLIDTSQVAGQPVQRQNTRTCSDSTSSASEIDDHVSTHSGKRARLEDSIERRARDTPPPFLAKVISYIERSRIPFEHVDAWVPSFVNHQQAGATNPQKCRLCYAGCATTQVQVSPDARVLLPLSSDDIADLAAFGEYSQKFSFDVGSGLPGRVYQSGVPSWERSVQNAPSSHFERCGGAVQWGIKTVLGIPIPSPNVGRIVILFYSRYDRVQSQDMVARIVDEFAKVRFCDAFCFDSVACLPCRSSLTLFFLLIAQTLPEMETCC